MYEMIPQCGLIRDVVPGDPWEPESAARFNAVNELLRREMPLSAARRTEPDNSCQIWVCNVSDTKIEIGQAVQLDTDFVPEDTAEAAYRLHTRNVYACGKPVENEMGFWGVALDNIQPGEGGPVQVAGISIIRYPEGLYETTDRRYGRTIRNNFIFPKKDGRYHFGQRGGAEVIWYDQVTRYALIRLGAPNHQYTGMFAVLDNFDGTLTVKGGVTDLRGDHTYEGSASFGVPIEDTVVPVLSESWVGIELVASRGDGPEGWVLEIVQDGSLGNLSYVPGEKISWTLASYEGRDEYGYARNLQQLWQGGCVNFRDRYFIT